jgi:hypothetical protein
VVSKDFQVSKAKKEIREIRATRAKMVVEYLILFQPIKLV